MAQLFFILGLMVMFFGIGIFLSAIVQKSLTLIGYIFFLILLISSGLLLAIYISMYVLR